VSVIPWMGAYVGFIGGKEVFKFLVVVVSVRKFRVEALVRHNLLFDLWYSLCLFIAKE
jgi:hypothetical protein